MIEFIDTMREIFNSAIEFTFKIFMFRKSRIGEISISPEEGTCINNDYRIELLNCESKIRLYSQKSKQMYRLMQYDYISYFYIYLLELFFFFICLKMIFDKIYIYGFFIMLLSVTVLKNIYSYHKYWKNLLKLNNVKLLVLRVFGNEDNTKFIYNNIANKWKKIGSVFTITDSTLYGIQSSFLFIFILVLSYFSPSIFFCIKDFIMGTSIDPLDYFILEVFMFKSGRHNLIRFPVLWLTVLTISYFVFNKIFVDEVSKITNIFEDKSNLKLGYLNKYQSIFLSCYDNVWKFAIGKFVIFSDVILIDLSNFRKERSGTAYEINFLVNNYSLEKVLFILDSTTDKNFLEESIKLSLNHLSSLSPNLNRAILISFYFLSDNTKARIRDKSSISKILCNKAVTQKITIRAKKKD